MSEDYTYERSIRAGIDRNMMVFDETADTGVVTSDLLRMMVEVAKDNGIKLDAFMIPVGDMAAELTQYYLSLQGTFPRDKTNLLIGFGPNHGYAPDHKRENPEFDDQHVLLGAF